MTSGQPGWYPDPTDPHRVRWFDGSAWTETVQPLPGVMTTGRAPSVPPGRGRGRFVVACVTVGVLISAGAAVAAWRLLGGPAELTADDYAGTFCQQVDAQLYGTPAYEEFSESILAVEGASANFNALEEWDEVDAAAFRSLHGASLTMLDSARRWIDRTGEFAEGHQLAGPDGGEAREDLIAWSEGAGAEIADALDELRELDLNDVAAGAERTHELAYDSIPTLPNSDGLRELEAAFEDGDRSCDFPYVEQP